MKHTIQNNQQQFDLEPIQQQEKYLQDIVQQNIKNLQELEKQEQQSVVKLKQIQIVDYKLKQNISTDNKQQYSYQNFEKMIFLSKLLNEFIICQIVGGITLQADFVASLKYEQYIQPSKQLLTYGQKDDNYCGRITTQQLEDSPFIPPSIRYCLNNPFRRQTCLIVLNDLMNFIKPITSNYKINVNNFISENSLYQYDIIREQIQQKCTDNQITVDINKIYQILRQLLQDDQRITGIINLPQTSVLFKQLQIYQQFYQDLIDQTKKGQKLDLQVLNKQFSKVQEIKQTNIIKTGEFPLLICNLTTKHFNIVACKRITNILFQNDNQDVLNNLRIIFCAILNKLLNIKKQLTDQQVQDDYQNTGIKIETIDEQFQYLKNIQQFLAYLVEQYRNMLNFIYTINKSLVSICSQDLFKEISNHASQVLITSYNNIKLTDSQKLVVNLINQQFSKQLKIQCENLLKDFYVHNRKTIKIQYKIKKIGIYNNWDKNSTFFTDSEKTDKLKESITQQFLLQEQQPELSQLMNKFYKNKVNNVGKQYSQQDKMYENLQDMCKYAINEFDDCGITYSTFFQEYFEITEDDIYTYIATKYRKYDYTDQYMKSNYIYEQSNIYQFIKHVQVITDNFKTDINSSNKGHMLQKQLILFENNREKIKEVKFSDYNSCLEQYRQIGIKILEQIQQYNNNQRFTILNDQDIYRYGLILPNILCRSIIPPLPQIYQTEYIQKKETKVFNCKDIQPLLQQLFQIDQIGDNKFSQYSIQNQQCTQLMEQIIDLLQQQPAYQQITQQWPKLCYNINFIKPNQQKMNNYYKFDLDIKEVIRQYFVCQQNIEYEMLNKNNIENMQLLIKDFISDDLRNVVEQYLVKREDGQTISLQLLGDLKDVTQYLFQFSKRMDKLKEFYGYYKEKYTELLNNTIYQLMDGIKSRVKKSVECMTQVTKQLVIQINKYDKDHEDFVFDDPESYMPNIITFSNPIDKTQSFGNKQFNYFQSLAKQFDLDKIKNVDKNCGQPYGLQKLNKEIESNILCYDISCLRSLLVYQNKVSKFAIQKQNGFKTSLIALDLYIQQISYMIQLIQNIDQFCQSYQQNQSIMQQKKEVIDYLSNQTNKLLQLTIEVISLSFKYVLSFQSYDVPQELVQNKVSNYQVRTLQDINTHMYSSFPSMSNIIKLSLELATDSINVLIESLPAESFIQVFTHVFRHYIYIYVAQLSRFTQNQEQLQTLLEEKNAIEKTWKQLYDEIRNKQKIPIITDNEIKNLFSIFDFLKQVFIGIPIQDLKAQNIPQCIISLMHQRQLRSESKQYGFLDGENIRKGL